MLCVCVCLCAVDDTIINKEDEKKRKKKRVLLCWRCTSTGAVVMAVALMSVCSVVQRCVLVMVVILQNCGCCCYSLLLPLTVTPVGKHVCCVCVVSVAIFIRNSPSPLSSPVGYFLKE